MHLFEQIVSALENAKGQSETLDVHLSWAIEKQLAICQVRHEPSKGSFV